MKRRFEKQILNFKFYNASDFEWKFLQRVRIWIKIFSTRQILMKSIFFKSMILKKHFEEINFEKARFRKKKIFKKHDFEEKI